MLFIEAAVDKCLVFSFAAIEVYVNWYMSERKI